MVNWLFPFTPVLYNPAVGVTVRVNPCKKGAKRRKFGGTESIQIEKIKSVYHHLENHKNIMNTFSGQNVNKQEAVHTPRRRPDTSPPDQSTEVPGVEA